MPKLSLGYPRNQGCSRDIEDWCAAEVRWALYFWFGLCLLLGQYCNRILLYPGCVVIYLKLVSSNYVMFIINNFWTNFTYPNIFTYLNTSQVYQKQRCSDNGGCTVRGELTHSAQVCAAVCAMS